MSETKHPGGRPLIIEDPIEMQERIGEYFNSCVPEYVKDSDDKPVQGKNGPLVKNINAPSVTGLALFLGYASRQSFYDNEKKIEFSYILKSARSRVEEWVYQSVMTGIIRDSVGIFILKQFGYSDRQEIINKTIFSVENMSEKELDNEIEKYEQKTTT